MMRAALPVFLAVALPAWAVDVTLSPGDPIATLTADLTPGSTVTFSDGVYPLDEQISWTGSGTEEEPIVYVAARNARPILRFAGGGNGIRLANAEWVEIRGLVIENTEERYESARQTGLALVDVANVTIEDVAVRRVGGTGVYFAGNNTGVTLRRVEVGDTRDGSGLYLGCGDASCWTQDSRIENCWLHDLKGGGSHGILIEHGGQGITIVDTVIHDVENAGIRVGSTEFGPENVIERNAIWRTQQAGVRIFGPAVVRNNLVFDIDGGGIYSDENNRGTFADVVIAHNTVVNTTSWGIQLDDWAGYTGLVFTNNVVANPTGRAFEAGEDDLDDGVVIAGNVFTGYVEAPFLDPEQGHYVAGAGWSDFADADGWDFFPVVGSRLVNGAEASADAWVPATDFNDAPRDGEAPEVGAYEFRSGGNPGWIPVEGFKETGFDPSSGVDVGGCGCGDGEPRTGLLLLPLALLARRRR